MIITSKTVIFKGGSHPVSFPEYLNRHINILTNVISLNTQRLLTSTQLSVTLLQAL